MYWLTRYSKLLDLTQDALCETIGMARQDIRDSLCNPEADLTRFVERVEAFRAEFERPLRQNNGTRLSDAHNPFPKRSPLHGYYGTPAPTLVHRRVKRAVALALSSREICEVMGRERLGKSTCMAHQFLLNLDVAAWIEAPTSHTEMEWIRAVANGLGVSAGDGDRSSKPKLRPRIDACLGANRVEVLFVDEGHRLLPRNLTKRPDRLEDLRAWCDQLGVSCVVGTTPQFDQSVQQMVSLADAGASFYRPGQWIGRRQAFDLPDMLTPDDVGLVARWHEPSLSDAQVNTLTSYAIASPGYIGSMIKVIVRARDHADEAGRPVSDSDLLSAQRLVDREGRSAVIKSELRIVKRGRRAA